MSFDPQSPSDMADLSDDVVAVCEYCDEVIDQADCDVEAFEVAGGPCCRDCFRDAL